MSLTGILKLLNPTRSLRARLGLFFGGLSLTLAILIAITLGNSARRHAEHAAAESLSSASAHMTYLLGNWLAERYEDIHVLAQLPPVRDAAGPPDRQQILEEYRRDYPGYAWLGLLTRDNQLLWSTTPEIAHPAPPPTTQPFIGGVRRLSTPLPDDFNVATGRQNQKLSRVLDLVVPVTDTNGQTWGMLWACLDWAWAEEVRESLEATLPVGQQENIVVARPDGTVLLGPAFLPRKLPAALVRPAPRGGVAEVQTWPDGRSYLTAVVHSTPHGHAPEFPYVVIARQPTDLAFAGPRGLERTMATGGIAVGLVFAGLGWALAARVAHPLTAIANAAERMRAGESNVQIPATANRDEVGALAESLRNLIAELHGTQSQLALARDEAESASRAKDRFLAVLSHELRTPLTPILMSLSQMKTEKMPEELRHDLEMIRRNADLEARLIDDLLDTTRIASGKLRLERQPADVHAILRYAMDTCQPDARGKGVSLVAYADAGEHFASADPARLEQILWNLLKNAIKFTPAGGTITVSTRNAMIPLESENGDAKSEQAIVIDVKDTGIGIPPASLPYIFQPFEQGDSKITSRFGGLGLGLAISKSLAESHGGSLAAFSGGADQGSTFTLTLPVLPARSERGNDSDESPSLPARPSPGSSSLRILLVEDHADTANLLARLLRSRGHTVATAGSVSAACAAAASATFDLVISDLGLPDGSGTDVMRCVRTFPHPPRGIAVSGYGTDADKRMTREAGFDAHLTKPIKLADLEPLLRVSRHNGMEPDGG